MLRGLLANHPHIVPITCISCPSLNEVRITYPRIPVSLRDCMTRSQAAPLQPVQVMLQLCRALSFCHGKNIVHRNVRPENILVKNGEGILTLSLTDFGLAKRVAGCASSTAEESRNRVQTDKERQRMQYRAPETLLRLKATSETKADMWSAGVVLVEVLTGSCPWENPSSVSELIVRILKLTGTPNEWPAIADYCTNWWPRFPVPDFAEIACNDGDTYWHELKASHGAQVVLLLGKLLQPDPALRLSSDECLTSPFLLGKNETESDVAEAREWFKRNSVDSTAMTTLAGNVGQPVPGQMPDRQSTVGWMFKISRLLECNSSRPVHVAIALFSTLGLSEDIAPSLIACLKMAQRFCVSKDMFKQISCSEIATACKQHVTEESIIRAEQTLLLRMDEIADCFTNSLIDSIETLLMPNCHTRLRYVAEYIADLCLFDDCVWGSADTLAHACVVLAAQWLTEDPMAHIAALRDVPIDSLTIALSQCASVLTERRAELITADNGLVMKIIEWSYRLPDGSWGIPKTTPTAWKTSRRYVESLVCPQGSNTPSRQTPPKPLLLRLSTIQHAKDWAVQSRKRSRSSTPLPGLRTKRMCGTPTKFLSENLPPANTPKPVITPKKVALSIDDAGMTPRRSARLAGQGYQINP